MCEKKIVVKKAKEVTVSLSVFFMAANELYLRSEGFRTRPPVADD